MEVAELLREDEEHAQETISKLSAGRLLARLPSKVRQEEMASIVEAVVDGTEETFIDPETAATVTQFVRPSLLVHGSEFDNPPSDTWHRKLADAASLLRNPISATGRIELLNHDHHASVGTGWLVAQDIVVTNRHVASKFARKLAGQYVFQVNSQFVPIVAQLDTREEFNVASEREFRVSKVLHIEAADGPDLAFLRVESTTPSGRPLAADPLTLADLDSPQDVAVIGYPSANSAEKALSIVQRIFQGVYGVKRLAPGVAKEVSAERLTHDCSTLSESSGSPLVSLESGHVVGIHFGGTFHSRNDAVPSRVIANRLARLT